MNIPLNMMALEAAIDKLIKAQAIRDTQQLDAMDAIELCTGAVTLYMHEVNAQIMGTMSPKIWH